MKYFANAKCEIKYAFSYAVRHISQRSYFILQSNISHAERRISLKKAPTKSMLFSGAPSGTQTLCVLLARLPKCSAFRYQPSHLQAKNLPQATFINACSPLRVRVPLSNFTNKKRHTRCLFCWCAIGDSNPGPTD